MADTVKLIETELQVARDYVDSLKSALEDYESRESWEQRDLARAEYAHKHAQTLSLNDPFWEALAKLAEPIGEASLFDSDAMAGDRKLAKKYAPEQSTEEQKPARGA